MKKQKICFIASSGGHFAELRNLKPLTERYDCFLVTEWVENFQSSFCEKKYFVKEINRKVKFFLFRMLWLFLRELFIFIKQRPSVVISTGALCAYPMLRIAKFFRKKVIYIESYARIDDLSTTGKKIYNHCDLFLVQWEELKEKYPKAEYVGAFFGE